jgi:hypothetical protein
MLGPYFERFLLVVGDQNTGKSTQLRSMFLDPRINDSRLGGKKIIPSTRDFPNLPKIYSLSHGRSLYLRLSSPHEKGEKLKEFLDDILSKAVSGRWCVAAAFQISPDNQITENLPVIVESIAQRFSPERIRICILSPVHYGSLVSDVSGVDIQQLVQELQAIPSCEVITIDARDRQANGLLLADTFDFT